MSAPHWGEAPWKLALAPRADPPPARCDVAVIGGGFTGLAAAYALAGEGARVALLEATRIGAGASGRSGGIALEGTHLGSLEGVDACLPHLERLLAETQISCDLQLDGCWELVHRPRGAGTRPLWRDGDSELCVEATVAGGTLDPAALLAGLARAAAERGATLHEGARVDRIELAPDLALTVGGRRLRAGCAIVALNAFTAQLLALETKLAPALTLALCTAPLDAEALAALGLATGRPFYTVDRPYLWGRPLPNGRVVFGGGLAFAGDGDPASAHIRAPEAAAALARLEARVRALHPALAEVAIERRWGGPVAFPPGRPPLLARHPSAPNLLVAGGYAGHGIALGLRAGELAARAALSGDPLPAWGRIGP